MKTIKEYLEELPEPWRSQALENCDPDNMQKDRCTSQRSALMSAFIWSKSPEGKRYWNDFYRTLLNNESGYPPEPETLKHFNERQLDAMKHHKWFLGEKLGRSPTMLETTISWIEEGYAERFRNGEIGE
jgi:hypothetical protein